MEKEQTLVLIKPDAMIKQLAGNIINDLYKLDLKMIGLKLVNVQKELAEKHYDSHKGKPFFDNLIKYITGEFHGNENVIAIAYEGENAIEKIRAFVGKTNQDEAHPTSLRGRYGKVHSKTNEFENVIHASDSAINGEKEIKLWFDDKELIK